jgi:hypothetical protein
MTASRVRSTMLCVVMLLLMGTAVVSTAGAAMTSIYTPIYGEPWLALSRPGQMSILETLYGADNFVRVDDSLDQIWWEYDGTADAAAKYAGHKHGIGFTQGTSGGDTQMFDTSGDGYNVTGGFTFDFNPNDELRFNFKDINTGDVWSSLQSENTLDPSSDHMVTFAITGGDSKGHFALAWEDLRLGASDRDYNDLVIEVAQVQPASYPRPVELPEPAEVPEPGSLVLLGLVLLGAGGGIVSRRHR